MEYLFFILAFFLAVIIFLLYKLYQFSLIILKIEESIEESLDILEENYQSMGKVLEKEIFFDSVEVRQVIAEIKNCHNSILFVANNLTKNVRNDGEAKEKDS